MWCEFSNEVKSIEAALSEAGGAWNDVPFRSKKAFREWGMIFRIELQSQDYVLCCSDKQSLPVLKRVEWNSFGNGERWKECLHSRVIVYWNWHYKRSKQLLDLSSCELGPALSLLGTFYHLHWGTFHLLFCFLKCFNSVVIWYQGELGFEILFLLVRS